MKVGDMVHDASLGLNGIIFDVVYEAAWPGIGITARRRWIILYEGGLSSKAYDSEIEVINENR